VCYMMHAARTFGVPLVMSLLTGAAQGQIAFLDQANVTRWAAGKYRYLALDTQQQNGEEDWLLTVHPDGSRTLRATNAYVDQAAVLRHVVLRADSDFRPLEAYLDYWVDGRWRGSGLATIDAETLELVVNSPNGRMTQSVAVPEHFSLVPHPIATDSWPAWYYDRVRGGPQTITLYVFDGRSLGPSGMMGQLMTQSLTLQARGTVTTPAGSFECETFAFGDGDPVLSLFGADQIIAKMTWKAAGVEYVLSEYRAGGRGQAGEPP